MSKYVGKRRLSSGKKEIWIMGIIVLAALATLGSWLFVSWIVMLLLGAIASLTGVSGLALGYWAVIAILAALAVISAMVKSLK